MSIHPGTRLFSEPKKRPSNWRYWAWYLFLASWMQGMAVMNIAWGILLIAAFPYIPYALQRLRHFPRSLLIPVGVYEVLRLTSTLVADHPMPAWIGMFDDLRYLTIALCALVFLRTERDLRNAAIASFIGFLLLGWSSLFFHFERHSFSIHAFQATSNLRYGSFGHVNYAAAWSAMAFLAMLGAFLRVPSFRWKIAILIAMVPLVLLQAPLNSRATILSAGLAGVILVLRHRHWKAMLITGAMAAIVAGTLIVTGSIRNFHATGSHGKLLTTLTIRLELFKLISHLVEDHPLGLGPRNHGFVDLNPHREWIQAHMPDTVRHLYGKNDLHGIDLNQPFPVTYDPHSQYATALAETGWLGLLSLLWLWGAVFVHGFRQWKSAHPWSNAIGEIAVLLIWLYTTVGFTVTLMHQPGGIIFFLTVALLGLTGSEMIFSRAAHPNCEQ